MIIAATAVIVGRGDDHGGDGGGRVVVQATCRGSATGRIRGSHDSRWMVMMVMVVRTVMMIVVVIAAAIMIITAQMTG